ncbi:MAG: hypothetical protein HZA93_11080 [Verrucomicrobia bacterium]|nr:hypothetical protein [Verrucomicrobiota bacterium]
MSSCPGILYCNCTYAQVLDPAAKAAVLRALCDSGQSFEAVADLCEMSARKDPALQRLTAGGDVKIVACHPRAVKWLFAAAGAPLDPARTEVVNLRDATPAAALERLAAADLRPNLPPGKALPADPAATSAEPHPSA